MARNPVQFQPGMSLGEFIANYGTEEQCEAALKTWRWPDGFVCPRCASRDHAIVGRRRLYECHACRRQTSLTAGTIFARTQLALSKWFQAMWLLTQSKGSVSTLELSRQLGVKWDSAWLMRQKLAEVMREAETGRRLEGRVEMDDAVLGGERKLSEGGKPGRAGANKIPFVIAVETREGRPQRLQLHLVASHTSTEIERIATAGLAPGTHVVSDGLGCFRAVSAAGCTHTSVVTSRIDGAVKLECFRWVNTILGNIKTAIAGTFHALRRAYVHRYLAEFQYRFNHRSGLARMFADLAGNAIHTSPRPYAVIKATYANG